MSVADLVAPAALQSQLADVVALDAAAEDAALADSETAAAAGDGTVRERENMELYREDRQADRRPLRHHGRIVKAWSPPNAPRPPH